MGFIEASPLASIWVVFGREAAVMKVNTAESETIVLDWRKVDCSLLVGGVLLPEVEEFRYLGLYSQVREDWSMRLMIRLERRPLLCGCCAGPLW